MSVLSAERARELRARFHAARKLRRIVLGELGKADGDQRFVRALIALGCGTPWNAMPSLTLSTTVRHGKSALSWNT